MNRHEKRNAIAIGNFDGFHRGHREIVAQLKRIAREAELNPVILTFTPNPKIFFGREKHLISTHAQKKEYLQSLSVRDVVFMDFIQVHMMDGERFIQDVLLSKYNLGYIVVGEKFRFGKHRRWNFQTLERLKRRHGFGVCLVPPVHLEGMRISSTEIRRRLARGEVDLAGRMLGHLYYIDGTVVSGEGLGRELGFPTMNIRTENTILPRGVFQTRIRLSGRDFPSVTNVGTNPTFPGNDLRVETHILDFHRRVYGAQVRLFFEKKIRDEIVFRSRQDLVRQIQKDIKSLRFDNR